MEVQGTRAPERRSAQWCAAAELPAELRGTEELEVYVNGVRQEEGGDFRREPGRLLFDRPLAREGRLGFWRWASMFLGIAGTYRQNDTVDVIYEHEGRRLVVSGLPIRRLG
jgi:hypothetical protein